MMHIRKLNPLSECRTAKNDVDIVSLARKHDHIQRVVEEHKALASAIRAMESLSVAQTVSRGQMKRYNPSSHPPGATPIILISSDIIRKPNGGGRKNCKRQSRRLMPLNTKIVCHRRRRAITHFFWVGSSSTVGCGVSFLLCHECGGTMQLTSSATTDSMLWGCIGIMVKKYYLGISTSIQQTILL